MARGKKPMNAGVGAKCSILTKFIHPKKTGFEDGHRTTCVLKEMKNIRVNRKDQQCYIFEENNVQYYAVARHFKVLEEGEKNLFFLLKEVQDDEEKQEEQTGEFKEPKVKWRKSRAKQILYDLLRDGTVPVKQKDASGNDTMPIGDIYALDESFKLYDPDKFKSRLQNLRKKILELDSRAAKDRKAFDIYKKNHKVSQLSYKGYIQWQGSDAQELIWDDIKAGKLDRMTKKQLWESRPEYKDKFPLAAFRKKIEQEIRTSKYVHTVRTRGVLHQSS
jgi:hypothetical protein